MTSHATSRAATVILRGLRLLNAHEWRVAIGLAVAIAVLELMQLAGMLLVVPVVSLLVDESTLTTSRHIVELVSWLGNPGFDRLVVMLALAALVMISVSHLGSFAVQAILEFFCARVQTRLVGDVLAECVTAPYAWFLDRNSSALTRLFQNDFAVWAREFVGSLLTVFSNVCAILGGVVLVLFVAPFSGLLALLLVALVSLAVIRLVRRRLIYWTSEKRRAAELSMIANTELLAGIKDVATSGAWRQFVAACVRRYGQMSHAAARTVILGALPAAALLLLAQVGLLIVLMAFWYAGSRGAALAAQMTLVMLVVARVIPSVGRLTAIFTRIVNAVPWVAGILDLRDSLLAAKEQGQGRPAGRRIATDWKQVRFEDVSFSYGGNRHGPIRHLTLTLERDRCYGIKGGSGAGKTTFVDLLLGLLAPTAGQIRIGDQPFAETDMADWRARIGYVTQHPYFLDGSIKSNIAFGGEVDEERIRLCIEQSGLGDFLAGLPNGANTLLGDRAVAVSGGQRQRIAIARALYRDPQLLVLDEATASLDAATEERIAATLAQLRRRMMIVIISHKDSTLTVCDEVFTLADGGLHPARPQPAQAVAG